MENLQTNQPHEPIDSSTGFDFGTNFVQDETGIWSSSKPTEPLAYPTDRNTKCFAVEDGSLWFRHRNECIAELLRSFPPGGTLFDIGGGNGFVSQHLTNQGFECVLVEPGPTGAFNAHVNRKLPTVVCGTSSDLTFLSGKIPAIGLFDVLEHIEDDIQFLKELYGLLMEGGQLYLTVPAHMLLWSAADAGSMHFRRYSSKQLMASLELAGFETTYRSGIFFPLIPAIFLFRSLATCWGAIRPKKKTQPAKHEHGMTEGLLWKVMLQLFQKDLCMISQKRTRQGASLLFVAQKKPREQDDKR